MMVQFIIIVENKYINMVKSTLRKEESDLSTSQSLCGESDQPSLETLSSIIDALPKLTHAQRRLSYRAHRNSKTVSRKWSQAETTQFYQSLRHYGLDFTLMAHHPTFQGRRSQKELSNKYKKEAKMNPQQVDEVLSRIDEEGLYALHHISLWKTR